MSVVLRYVIATGAAVIAATGQPVFAQAGTIGEGEEIACPQTLISPEAQARIDQGEKPDVALSLYQPGILSNNGFCRVVVGHDGKLVRTYNEGASVSNIALRVEFRGSMLHGYVGPKAAPFGKGAADLRCFAPDQEFSAGCSTMVDQAEAISVGFDYDRNVSNMRVSIDPEKLFKTKVSTPNIAHHTSAGDALSVTGTYYTLDSPDCEQNYWQNLATIIAAETGVASAEGFSSRGNFTLTAADEFTPDILAASFRVDGDLAKSLVDGLLAGNAVKVVVSRACESELSTTLSTDVLRVSNHMFGVMQRQMMTQNIRIKRNNR